MSACARATIAPGRGAAPARCLSTGPADAFGCAAAKLAVSTAQTTIVARTNRVLIFLSPGRELYTRDVFRVGLWMRRAAEPPKRLQTMRRFTGMKIDIR